MERDAAQEKWRSVRRGFLQRGKRQRGRDGEGAELGGELSGVEASAGVSPVLGSELEVAVAGPVARTRKRSRR